MADMTAAPEIRPASSPPRKRRFWLVLPLIAALATGGYLYWKSDAATAAPEGSAGYLIANVQRASFVHEVVERGDIESSHNVEVRCEVRARSQLGTPILELVPEGTHVQEGDLLVRLDDSALQTDLVNQQISVHNSEAVVAQAETAVETAKLARQEYENGTFKQEVGEVQSLVFVAQENLRRAEEYYSYSLRLAAKGYVTSIQLEADKFAVEKARKDLDVAKTKLDVLVNFTREKTLRKLDADIFAAEAKFRTTKEAYQIELAQLKHVKEQIAKCVITAPSSGQVVYANDNSSRSADILIEEGRLVRERQAIIRLPNPEKMQVVAKINESRIDLVQPGLKAKIRVDALPGVELVGRVRRVSEYPFPTSQFTSHLKNYATMIEIESPTVDLRPGMTAQASILVEQLEDAMQIPVQAVIEKSGRHFCLHTEDGLRFQPREIAIGSTNSKFIVVRQGLSEKDKVVLMPKSYFDGVDWPTLLASRPAWKDAEEALAAADQNSRRVAARKPAARPANRLDAATADRTAAAR